MSSVVEVRCPIGPQRLFTKLRLGEITYRYLMPDNVIEFLCSDCGRRLSTQERKVTVFHRFNFAGELVETVTEPPAG